jgi:hypothetical protein
MVLAEPFQRLWSTRRIILKNNKEKKTEERRKGDRKYTGSVHTTNHDHPLAAFNCIFCIRALLL